MTKQELRDRIKALKKKGITQTEIVKKLNIDRGTLSRAKRDIWPGDSSRVFREFEREYK